MAPHHLLDDAVSSGFTLTDGGDPIAGSLFTPQNYIPSYDGLDTSKDLAFALYTVPEPASLGLIGIAVPALFARRNRRRA